MQTNKVTADDLGNQKHAAFLSWPREIGGLDCVEGLSGSVL